MSSPKFGPLPTQPQWESELRLCYRTFPEELNKYHPRLFVRESIAISNLRTNAVIYGFEESNKWFKVKLEEFLCSVKLWEVRCNLSEKSIWISPQTLKYINIFKTLAIEILTYSYYQYVLHCVVKSKLVIFGIKWIHLWSKKQWLEREMNIKETAGENT